MNLPGGNTLLLALCECCALVPLIIWDVFFPPGCRVILFTYVVICTSMNTSEDPSKVFWDSLPVYVSLLWYSVLWARDTLVSPDSQSYILNSESAELYLRSSPLGHSLESLSRQPARAVLVFTSFAFHLWWLILSIRLTGSQAAQIAG